jgi:phage shock protein PspC (stress-responsive transcriptional regulator)
MTEHSSEYATTTGGPPPARYDIRNLRRSSDDRIIAGVCGGLGRYTGLDPIIFRIVLATLAVFGGIGLLLYALAWLLVPQDNATTSEAHRIFQGHAGVLPTLAAIGVGIIGVLAVLDVAHHGIRGPLALIIILAVIAFVVLSRRNSGSGRAEGPYSAAAYAQAYAPPAAFVPPPPTGATAPLGPPAGFAPSRPVYAPPPPPPPRPPREPSMLLPLALSAGVVIAGILFALDASRSIDISAQAVFAAALLTIGLALVVGTWIGRARALIAVGVVLAVMLAITAAIDVPLRGGIGSRAALPTSVAEIQSSYHVGIGQQTIDLSQVQFGGKTVHIGASVGVGRLVVDVPSGVSVVIHAHAGVGDLSILGYDTSGNDVTRDISSPATASSPATRGAVDLDLRVGIGQVAVFRPFIDIPPTDIPVPPAPASVPAAPAAFEVQP